MPGSIWQSELTNLGGKDHGLPLLGISDIADMIELGLRRTGLYTSYELSAAHVGGVSLGPFKIFKRINCFQTQSSISETPST